MAQVIILIVVTLGFLTGNAVAGNFGCFLGGLLTFVASLLVIDLTTAGRSTEGFLLRHRGSLVEFVAVIAGIIIGQHFYNGLLGILGGIAAGIFSGQWLTNRLGWGGESFELEVGVRVAYLAILHSLATTGTGASERERNELWLAAKRLFLNLGYTADNDVTLLLAQAEAGAASIDMPNFVAALPRDWQCRLLLDAMRIVYSSPTVAAEKRNFIETLFTWTNIADRSLLSLYDRSATNGPDMRNLWLEELGLPPSATPQDIEKAYRQLALEYHPDRLTDLHLPPHMAELAQAKMAAVNAAYAGLKGRSAHSEGLRFRPEVGEDPFLAVDGQAFQCRCWLCDRTNRVPAQADLATVRCGECHALLGVNHGALNGT
ncbi:MAG: hypothetical protein KatS3mg105_4200 [Gemmatales bacterium]|nr:MAG: hypothetical protein KatS3mg105_4200 [Gemmatales bacterium]